jgi:hypothetical protein
MLTLVKQPTIAPLVKSAILPGTLIYTDESRIYSRLSKWGMTIKASAMVRLEYARDEDGDGFCDGIGY